jgi:hypothetical protein
VNYLDKLRFCRTAEQQNSRTAEQQNRKIEAKETEALGLTYAVITSDKEEQ